MTENRPVVPVPINTEEGGGDWGGNIPRDTLEKETPWACREPSSTDPREVEGSEGGPPDGGLGWVAVLTRAVPTGITGS